MIELNEREEEDGDNHRESADIVWVSGANETWVLGVLERSHRNLGGREEVRIADSVVVDVELEDTVDVWELELSHEVAAGRLESRADERVQADELELDVGVFERFPFAVHYLFDFYLVDLLRRFMV